MKKRLLSALLALTLMLALLPAVPAAERQEGTAYELALLEKIQEAREVTLTAWDEDGNWVDTPPDDAGQCGDNLFYAFDGATRTLTITGTGAMWEKENYGDYFMPWSEYAYEIRSLSLPSGMTHIAEQAFEGLSSLRTLVVPEGVRTMGSDAFAYCTSLQTASLPASLQKIGPYSYTEESPFYCCDSLTSIQVAAGNRVLCSVDGVLYETDGSSSWDPSPCVLLQVPGGKTGNLAIPDTVEEIKGLAGYRNSLSSVTIPASVNEIGYNSFGDGKNLCSIQVDEANPEYASRDGVLYTRDLRTLLQFPGGRTGSFTVPSHVVQVLSYALQDSSLSHVTIPDSVRYAGNAEGVFYYTISDPGFGLCFSGSKELTSVDLPGTMTALTRSCFSNCGFKSFTIPAGIQTIGESALSRCENMTSVILPDSVTYIDDAAFSYNSSLTSITIPVGVQTIDYMAFYRCDRLTSVRFCGAPPALDSNVISSWRDENWTYHAPTFYYPRSQEAAWAGFSYTTSQGDPVRVLPWGTVDAEELTGTLTAEQLAVLVVDGAGAPIQGASVIYRPESGETQTGISDEKGMTVFSRYRDSDGGYLSAEITASADGYQEGSASVGTAAATYRIVKLYSAEDSRLKLASALYSNFQNMTLSTDLLTGYKRLSNSPDFDNGTFYLRCRAGDESLAARYTLMQGNKQIAQSQTGDFTVQLPQLAVGKGFSVLTESADGTSVQTDLNLEIMDDKAQEVSSIKLGSDVTFTVGDDVPFLGGSELKLDLPALPLEVYVSDDSVHLGVNVNLRAEDRKSTEENLQELRETIQGLQALKSMKIDKNLQSRLDKLMKSHEAFEMPAAGKVKVNFIGYGEGKLDANGEAMVTFYLCLQVDASYTMQGPTVVVVVVPMTYSIKVGVEAKGEFEGSYNFMTSDIKADLTLLIKPYLEAFGGAGVGQVIGAGAYGSAEVPVEIQLLGTTVPPGLNSVELTGELGLKAYVGPLEYKKAWAHHTWYLYTREGLMDLSGLGEPSGESGWQAADLSYLSEESPWLDTGDISLLDASGETGKWIPLRTSTYRNARPVLAVAGTTPVLVWLGADAERGSGNATQVLYSVYDGTGWSQPQAVDSDLTGDYAPSVYSDGTDLWLVYQNSASVLADSGDLAQAYAAAQTVAAARFENGAFTAPQTISSGIEAYRYLPGITLTDGVPAAVWVENEDTSDLLGRSGTNRVMLARYENGSWASPLPLDDQICAVTELQAGQAGGVFTAAWISDGDNDLATAGDRSLTVCTDSGASMTLARGELSGLTFASLPGESETSLLWYGDGQLWRYDGSGSPVVVLENAVGLAKGFTVLSDRIVFNAAAENASELFAYVWSDGAWCGPVQLTEQGSYLQSYALAQSGGMIYAAAVQASVTITDEDVAENCTLSWMVLGGVTDVGVDYVTCDAAQAAPGASVPVTVGISNCGDRPLSGAQITIQDVSETVQATYSLTEPLAPGASGEYVLSLALPEDLTAAQYTVVVTAEGDGNMDNDAAAFQVGGGDLGVTAQTCKVGENVYLLAEVSNSGTAPLSGVLEVYALDGTVPATSVEVATLERGEHRLVRIDASPELLSGLGSGIVTLRLLPYGEDLNALNNTALQFVDLTCTVTFDDNGGTGGPGVISVAPDTAVDLPETEPVRTGFRFLGWADTPEADQALYQPGEPFVPQGSTVLYAVWESYTDALTFTALSASQATLEVRNSAPALVTAAVYDEAGKQVARASREVGSDAGEVVLPLDLTSLPQGFTAKAFLLRQNGKTPLCQAAEWKG